MVKDAIEANNKDMSVFWSRGHMVPSLKHPFLLPQFIHRCNFFCELTLYYLNLNIYFNQIDTTSCFHVTTTNSN